MTTVVVRLATRSSARRHDQRSRDLEGEHRASAVKDLIVDEVRRNRLLLTELQRELSGLDVPSHAPESTIWSTLYSEYLATTPDVVLSELYSDIARIDRLLTEYRRALQHGALHRARPAQRAAAAQ